MRGDREAHALLGNWGKLKSLLRYQKWGDLEFQREALTARVAREEGDDIGATSHWAAAVTLAADRRTALSALGRFAVAWKWEKEYTSLCWTIANGRGQQASALHQLLQKYTAEAKTRDILRVYTRMLELDSENLNLKNNRGPLNGKGTLISSLHPSLSTVLCLSPFVFCFWSLL